MRGGQEPDRHRRRLVPVHHATRGGPESARIYRRPGPEPHAPAAGRCLLNIVNIGTESPTVGTRAVPDSLTTGTGGRSPTVSRHGPRPIAHRSGLFVPTQVLGPSPLATASPE